MNPSSIEVELLHKMSLSSMLGLVVSPTIVVFYPRCGQELHCVSTYHAYKLNELAPLISLGNGKIWREKLRSEIGHGFTVENYVNDVVLPLIQIALSVGHTIDSYGCKCPVFGSGCILKGFALEYIERLEGSLKDIYIFKK